MIFQHRNRHFDIFQSLSVLVLFWKTIVVFSICSTHYIATDRLFVSYFKSLYSGKPLLYSTHYSLYHISLMANLDFICEIFERYVKKLSAELLLNHGSVPPIIPLSFA